MPSEKPNSWSDHERKVFSSAWWAFELLNDERRLGVPVELRVTLEELITPKLFKEALRRQGYRGREALRQRFANQHKRTCTRPGKCNLITFDGLHKANTSICCNPWKVSLLSLRVCNFVVCASYLDDVGHAPSRLSCALQYVKRLPGLSNAFIHQGCMGDPAYRSDLCIECLEQCGERTPVHLNDSDHEVDPPDPTLASAQVCVWCVVLKVEERVRLTT